MFSRYFLSKITMILSLFIIGSCDEYEVVEGADFNPDIAGIFLGECSQCHANGKSENGFGVVDNVPAMIQQEFIVPGSPDSSKVLNRIKGKNLPKNAYRMPLRGPFLDEDKILNIENWITFDLPKYDPNKSHKVTINLGSQIKIEGKSESIVDKTVKDGEKLSITITDPEDASSLIIDSESCKDPRTSLKGNVFTTGKIVNDCAISIVSPGESPKPTITASSLYGVGESKAVPGVVIENSTITIDGGQTATFNFTVREGDTINTDDLSKSIEGDCELGSMTVVDEANRKYSYETGKVEETCEIKFKTDTPCPTIPSEVTTFTAVKNIFSNSETQNCMDCHQTDEFGAKFGDTEIEYNKLVSFVKASDPWNSEVYRQIHPTRNYAGRMPESGKNGYLSVTNQTKVCKWILDGAQNN